MSQNFFKFLLSFIFVKKQFFIAYFVIMTLVMTVFFMNLNAFILFGGLAMSSFMIYLKCKDILPGREVSCLPFSRAEFAVFSLLDGFITCSLALAAFTFFSKLEKDDLQLDLYLVGMILGTLLLGTSSFRYRVTNKISWRSFVSFIRFYIVFCLFTFILVSIFLTKDRPTFYILLFTVVAGGCEWLFMHFKMYNYNEHASYKRKAFYPLYDVPILIFIGLIFLGVVRSTVSNEKVGAMKNNRQISSEKID